MDKRDREIQLLRKVLDENDIEVQITTEGVRWYHRRFGGVESLEDEDG